MTYTSSIAGTSGKEYIDEILEDEGPLRQTQSVSDNVIAQYQGKVPDILIDFWRNHGTGTLQNGLMRLVIPSDFDGLLSQIFHGDADFSHQDCYIIGHSPFGHLVVWSERHWLVKIDLLMSRMDCSKLLYPEKKKNENTPIISGFLGHGVDSLNVYDDDDKPLFSRVRKRLGDLEPGECYGFAPALVMGGAPKLTNLKKMPAFEHFLFLAQLQHFTLMDYLSRPIRAVRQIG